MIHIGTYNNIRYLDRQQNNKTRNFRNESVEIIYDYELYEST